MYQTRTRSLDWHSEESLYHSAIEVSPGSAKCQFNLGQVLLLQLTAGTNVTVKQEMLRKGNLLEARRYFNESATIAPFFARAVWKLGKVESFLGNNTRAIELIERAIELDPKLPFTYAVHHCGH